MESEKVSGSAIFAALTRAAHLFFDGEPKILHDNYTLGFSGMRDVIELKTALEALRTEDAKALYFNGRTDELSPSVLDGLFASVIRLFHIMKAKVSAMKLRESE